MAPGRRGRWRRVVRPGTNAVPPPSPKESMPVESSAPARVLIVAHRTAATPALQQAVQTRAAAAPAVFALLVRKVARGLPHVVNPGSTTREEAGVIPELARPLLEEASGSHIE